MNDFWHLKKDLTLNIAYLFVILISQNQPMSEKEILIDTFDPIEIFGANDSNMDMIRKYFPKLKIITRGETLKLIGDDDEIRNFEERFERIMHYYRQYGIIDENSISDAMGQGNNGIPDNAKQNDGVLLHGRNGMLIRARTPNQRKMVESCETHDLVMAIGPAGTGKTYTAVAIAVRALKNKEVKRIVLTRPAVEAGENLGFLPGDLKEKLDPYMQPLYDALWDMIPQPKLSSYIEDRVIEIAPLAFMRGRTLDNVFVILDEAQNATIGQMKMFLTRMGKSAKFIVTGDITQVDLPKNQASGLVHAMKIIQGIEGTDIINLDHSDIIRHKLVTRILNAYNEDAGQQAIASKK
jgi:phosphate starvation-inducible protein PhoH and related proteins